MVYQRREQHEDWQAVDITPSEHYHMQDNEDGYWVPPYIYFWLSVHRGVFGSSTCLLHSTPKQ